MQQGFEKRCFAGARVARLGAPRIPVGYAPTLEAEARVTVAQIAAAARKLTS